MHKNQNDFCLLEKFGSFSVCCHLYIQYKTETVACKPRKRHFMGSISDADTQIFCICVECDDCISPDQTNGSLGDLETEQNFVKIDYSVICEHPVTFFQQLSAVKITALQNNWQGSHDL